MLLEIFQVTDRLMEIDRLINVLHPHILHLNRRLRVIKDKVKARALLINRVRPIDPPILLDLVHHPQAVVVGTPLERVDLLLVIPLELEVPLLVILQEREVLLQVDIHLEQEALTPDVQAHPVEVLDIQDTEVRDVNSRLQDNRADPCPLQRLQRRELQREKRVISPRVMRRERPLLKSSAM